MRLFRLVPSRSRERRKRFGLLLLVLTAAFLEQGIANPGPWESVLASLLLATTLVLSLWVAEARSSVLTLAIVAATAIFAITLVAAISGHWHGVAVQVANLLLVILAPPAIILGLVKDLRAGNTVSFATVFGVLCLYLLLGMFFAFAYALIGHVAGPFFADNAAATTPRYLYFSFTTLTTVGYGDYTAASNLGHTLSVSEALVGQIYLVTVVSVIVSNLGRTSPRAEQDSAPAPEG